MNSLRHSYPTLDILWFHKFTMGFHVFLFDTHSYRSQSLALKEMWNHWPKYFWAQFRRDSHNNSCMVHGASWMVMMYDAWCKVHYLITNRLSNAKDHLQVCAIGSTMRLQWSLKEITQLVPCALSIDVQQKMVRGALRLVHFPIKTQLWSSEGSSRACSIDCMMML